MNALDLQLLSRQIRYRIVQLSHQAGAAHLASSLSCVEILVAAYWGALRIDSKNIGSIDRDRFILSKGHAATTLYSVLNKKGLLTNELLATFGKLGSPLAEHPTPRCAPGVEMATGSLGHGLPVGIGLALSARIQKLPYWVCVCLSDGECNEGSVWEGALFAAAQKLGKLCIIVDYNKWQATGRSNEVMQLEPLVDKWRSFGWEAVEVDGHSIPELQSAYAKARQDGRTQPFAIIAHTVKGKGVSFMEDDNNWHYRIPKPDEVEKAGKELGVI